MKIAMTLMMTLVFFGCDDGGNAPADGDVTVEDITSEDVVWEDVPVEDDLQADDANAADAAPGDDLEADVTVPIVFEGYTLIAPLQSKTTTLMDIDQQTVREWTSDYPPGHSVYLLETGNLLRTGTTTTKVFDTGGAGGIVEEFDGSGEKVWEFVYDDAEHRAHHDIEPMPNGNVLVIAWEMMSTDEAIAAGRDPDLLTQGELWVDHLIEVNRDGEIVWEWRVRDHLIQDVDSEKANYGDVIAHPELIDFNYQVSGPPGGADWNHMNSVDYSPELDQIMLSVRNFSEIWIIDHSTTTAEAATHAGGISGRGGDLLYRWGNPAAYRAGDEGDQQLFVQHDAQWILPDLPGAGNVLVFNNGTGRPGGDHSTVDELVLPTDASGGYLQEAGAAYGPDGPSWTYIADPASGFYAERISGAQRLPNGNTLICRGTDGYVFEVTPMSEVVWSYVAPKVGPKGTSIFRAERYAPDFPGLAALELGR